MILSYLILGSLTCASAQIPPLNKENLKDLLTESEWQTIIGTGDHDQLDIFWNEVSSIPPRGENRVINLPQSIGSDVTLTLKPHSIVLDSYFVMLSRKGNQSQMLPQSYVRPHCFYRAHGIYKAALDLCEGVRGIVKSPNATYFVIHPLPQRFHKRSYKIPHVVVTKSLTHPPDYPDVSVVNLRNSISEQLAKQEAPAIRTRRSTTDDSVNPVHVETAVFVDRDLYEHMTHNFPTDTEKELVRFVLTMVNAVELLYHDPSLGRQVSFVMKRLEILHTDPTGLVRSHDIDRFLGNFCHWQRGENPPNDSDPLHWDHALILTGLDLYVLSKNGKLSKQVVGLAPVAGMCAPTSSCTVNEGRHFESVYVVAHEIGHNLGMRHDGPLADNNCDPGSFLMSPTLGSGKITWSYCSRQYLQQFLQTPQSHCLMDHSSPGAELDHSDEGTLPGERFDAHQQCMLKYGWGSQLSSTQPLNEICRDLHCTRDRYTWTSHPALEGTSCGSEKWCRSGRCIEKGLSAEQAVQQVVTGGWSDWTSYSDCASGCLYGNKGNLAAGSTGVMVASRLCNNPRPENGGDPCIGSDKKYKTCIPSQCVQVPKTTIQNFSDEVCSRAKEVDPELTGTGLQKISSDPEDACIVWCHKRGGGIKSKGWTFPDGTTCQTHRRQRPMYCISGVCQEFRCHGNGGEEEVFVLSANMCSSTQLFSRDKRREIAVGVWLPISDCYFNCISPGTGLRLVEKRPCRYCNTTANIQICQSTLKTCETLRTTTEQASHICTRYGAKVSRLSGLGVQLSPSPDDPDRPCHLACQDEAVTNRFYIVNGEDGWFPFGTDCSRGDPTRKAFCVSGKCLDFGSDDTPLHESEYYLPLRNHLRYRRDVSNKVSHTFDPYDNGEYDYNISGSSFPETGLPIDWDNPVHIKEQELYVLNELKPHV